MAKSFMIYFIIIFINFGDSVVSKLLDRSSITLLDDELQKIHDITKRNVSVSETLTSSFGGDKITFIDSIDMIEGYYTTMEPYIKKFIYGNRTLKEQSATFLPAYLMPEQLKITQQLIIIQNNVIPQVSDKMTQELLHLNEEHRYTDIDHVDCDDMYEFQHKYYVIFAHLIELEIKGMMMFTLPCCIIDFASIDQLALRQFSSGHVNRVKAYFATLWTNMKHVTESKYASHCQWVISKAKRLLGYINHKYNNLQLLNITVE